MSILPMANGFKPKYGGIAGGLSLGEPQPIQQQAVTNALEPPKAEPPKAYDPSKYFGINPNDQGNSVVAKLGRGIGHSDPSQGITDEMLGRLSKEFGTTVTRGKTGDQVSIPGIMSNMDMITNYGGQGDQKWWTNYDPTGINSQPAPQQVALSNAVGGVAPQSQLQDQNEYIRRMLGSLGVKI